MPIKGNPHWKRSGTNISQRNVGDSIRLYDSTDVDYLELSHDGTNALIGSNVGDIKLDPASSSVNVVTAWIDLATDYGLRWAGGSKLYEQASRMFYQPNGDRWEVLNETGSSFLFGVHGVNSGLSSRIISYHALIISTNDPYTVTTPPLSGFLLKGSMAAGFQNAPEKMTVNGNIFAIDSSVVGAEKITNGTFTGSAASWTLNTGWTYSADTVLHSSNGTGTLLQTSANMVTPLVVGETYILTFDLSAPSVGTVRPACGGVTLPIIITDANAMTGTHTFVFTATSTADLTFTPSNTARFTIDTVSLKKCTGGNLKALGNLNLMSDNSKAYFGEGNDASIYYDGTDLIINPKEVGSGNVNIKGDLELDSANAVYLGDSATDGSWRMIRSGTDLSFERRESGSWVNKGYFV